MIFSNIGAFELGNFVSERCFDFNGIKGWMKQGTSVSMFAPFRIIQEGYKYGGPGAFNGALCRDGTTVVSFITGLMTLRREDTIMAPVSLTGMSPKATYLVSGRVL